MKTSITRREMLEGAGRTAAAAGVAGALNVLPVHAEASARRVRPLQNDRLVGALIGCGGMGRGNMNNFMGHGGQIAAVCDVDSSHMAAAAEDVKNRQGRVPDQIKD